MIKKYGFILLVILVAAGGITSFVSIRNNKKLRSEYNISMSNIKAYEAENSKLQDDNRVFSLTTEMLNYSNDSLVEKLNEARKDLGIKDKNLYQLQYQITQAEKVDTIVTTDTLFRTEVCIDTLIHDEWYSLRMKLEYPSTLIIKPSFKSEKYTIISYKKETVNPPKKFFLLRWFQKKQKVLTVDVIEKSPYINTEKYRVVKILN